jgi:hypothetical protein
MSQTKKAYVVQRVRWVYTDRAEPLLRDEEGAGVPVKVFADPDRAEAHCRPLHRRAAKKAIPFEHGVPFGHADALPSLAAYTSLSTEDFLRLLTDLGVEPPDLPAAGEPGAAASSYAVWCSWWYENARRWPPAVLQRLWDALDKVQLYEVRAVTAEL